MKKNGTGIRRIGSVFLAMWLCIALLPMGAFAEELPEAGIQEDENQMLVQQDADTENVDEDVPAEAYEVNGEDDGQAVIEEDYDESAAPESDDIAAAPAETATSFNMDGYKLKFKEPVVYNQHPKELRDAAIDHVWIKAGKTKMTVNWNLAKQKYFPANSGIIVLRAGGPRKTYSELARMSLWTIDEEPLFDPVTNYIDKTAKAKNTPYSYVAVVYCTKDDGNVYLSHISDWAAGQTTASRLKSVYKAGISKKSVKMQYRESTTLSVKYAKPSQTYGAKTFRWLSDDKSVASVNQAGKVSAKGAGTTYVRCRLVSGQDVKCKVHIIWAYAPGTPKLAVDVASNSSITLKWNKTNRASYYYLYRSDDGLHWQDPVKVKDTSNKVPGLKKGHRYTFYVTAVNDNHGYTKESSNSNVVNQKAVIKRRKTTVSGWPTAKTLSTSSSMSVRLTVGSPDGRRANLQMQTGNSWTTKKTIYLPSGAGKSSVSFTFPDSWKGATTKWRLVIPKSNTSTEYITKTLTIKAARVYSNPGGFPINNTISKHGYSYYTSKVLINNNSTRSNCVEALIKTANKYMGDRYVNGKSGAPGSGIDASGLVIQSCYGAGVDIWPVSPATRPSNCVPKIWGLSKLGYLNYTDNVKDPTDHPGIFRGDLIFFNTGGGVGHVAIYLGWDKIIHADMVTGRVGTSTISKLTDPKGKYRYSVYGAKRIFK